MPNQMLAPERQVAASPDIPDAISPEYLELKRLERRTQTYLHFDGKSFSEVFHALNLLELYTPKTRAKVSWSLKRTIDFLGALFGLILISLLLVLVAACIKFESPGPIFFRQKRVGKYGEIFKIWKFRSMYTDAEARLSELLAHNQTNNVMFKMENDPRVTKVGRFIRKYSIDELPQLFNVLTGEMSLVGPRPALPREVEAYKPWHYVRLASTPGLTGAWQVSGRSTIKDFEDVVKLDFKYIHNWSLFQDIAILFKTVPVVLYGKDTA